MLRNKRKLDKQEKRCGVSSEMRKSLLTVSKWQGKSRGLSSVKGAKRTDVAFKACTKVRTAGRISHPPAVEVVRLCLPAGVKMLYRPKLTHAHVSKFKNNLVEITNIMLCPS